MQTFYCIIIRRAQSPSQNTVEILRGNTIRTVFIVAVIVLGGIGD